MKLSSTQNKNSQHLAHDTMQYASRLESETGDAEKSLNEANS